jgi:hypothetical protein
MATVHYQQTLRGLRSSNRAFRYRRLKASEVDALELKCARLVASKGDAVPADARQSFYHQTRYNEGIKLMLTHVTKDPVPVLEPLPLPPKDENGNQPPAPLAEEPDLKEESLWVPVDVGTLTMPGPYNYDELFTAPDHNHLKAVFIFNHEADLGEAESIAKKERTVSTG